jgi:hypothetical protein
VSFERGMYMVYYVETQEDGFVGLCKIDEYKEFFKNYYTRERVENYLLANGYSAVDLIMFNNVDYEMLRDKLAQIEIEKYEKVRENIRNGRGYGSNFYSGNFHFFFDYD